MHQNSLDFLEKQSYGVNSSPMDSKADTIVLSKKKNSPEHTTGCELSLDGEWMMAEGYLSDMVKNKWENPTKVTVPGSIHAALYENGLIPDPSFGKNDQFARENSFKTWWMAKEFDCDPQKFEHASLMFSGVCESCDVWLNGQFLGSHKGMFGGPDFDVSGLLRDHNRLIVKIAPITNYPRKEHELSDFFDISNVAWLNSVVFNCVYGWHYANVPALGIWQSVTLKSTPQVSIIDPFVATTDVQNGTVDLVTELTGPEGGFSGKLQIEISPDNFTGDSYFAETQITSAVMRHKLHYRFQIPDAHLWWPNDFGTQDLYQMKLIFQTDDQILDSKRVTFGIRTIEHLPLPEGARPDKYEWLFVINGQKMFIKGTNWCTIDYLMHFNKERYDRFLTLAKNQHIQLLRAWGGGLVETEEFYDLCDRKGIMVFQEWPTAWDSQKVQPVACLIETVKRNVVRLRNHASLALWCGGNESGNPTDAVIDMMAKYTYELDGTRRFHRGEPWGGSAHNYDVYWGRKEPDHNLHFTADFIGEFGLASSPNIESARKYLSEEDFQNWPPADDGNFAHHTPMFNQNNDLPILMQYAEVFSHNQSLPEFINASQIAQATGIRHTLELARTRFPECAGTCYYKLTDVFPSIAWSTIDYYGVPKFSYYIIQDSYQPLCAVVLFDKLNFKHEKASLPIYVLDDTELLQNCRNWKVTASAYNGSLKKISDFEYGGTGALGQVKQIGTLTLTEEMTDTDPLFVVSEICCDEKEPIRSFYWLNYQYDKDWMAKLPKTSLDYTIEEQEICISNTGSVPAVAVHFNCENISDRLIASDNFFWLNPGEMKKVAVNDTRIDGVSAWNV